MADWVNALKEWTGKAKATIIYDSTVDEFTDNGIFNNVKGKQNIALVGFTSDGDVLGGFYSVAVTVQDWGFKDPDMFIFSFESHGRCMTPQRFPVKNERLKKFSFVGFWKNNSQGFVNFGMGCVGGFYFGNEKSKSWCDNLSRCFEGLEDTTLTGKTGLNTEDEHHCSRLVALQLE